MTAFELYVFLLCLIVFTLFTGLFCALLGYIIKLKLKTIRHGLEDEHIKKEYQKVIAVKPAARVVENVVSGLVLVIFFAMFAASLYVQLVPERVKGDILTPKVVLSDSMSRKHESNAYLTERGLDDQFDTHDLIFLHALPDEFELELYDIVAYDYHGSLVIHRIVGIEEPNEQHPDCRHFLLRGDSIKYSDEFPVLYGQMRAIYEGERIRFVGSFFAFMQSPAGYLCVLLVIFATIATPILEKKLWNVKLARLREIGVIPPEEDGVRPSEQTKGGDES